MALTRTTYLLYRTVDFVSDLQPSLGDCFVRCIEDGFLYNVEEGSFTKISNIMFLNRTDVYTGAGVGTIVNASTKAVQSFTVQVKGLLAPATSWDVTLEGSLDGVNFTPILQHTTTTGDGVTLFSGTAFTPCLYFRSKVNSLILGVPVSISVNILGIQ